MSRATGDPPAVVRAAAWFFLVASVAGAAGTAVELAAAAGGGPVMIPVPLAFGLSGFALYRGLRAGDPRALRWARGVSAAAAAAAAVMLVVALIAPAGATFSILGRHYPLAAVLPALLPGTAAAIVWFAWLIRRLGSVEARRHFGLEPVSESIGIPAKETV